MNTFGEIFRLTTFGESHGPAIGGVIDGMPAGIGIDLGVVQRELDRRRPGQSALTTPRKESDRVEILSGLFEGKTTGTPIGFIIRNENQHSADYDNLRDVFRPSHADYTYYNKYGIRDHRGGGRASARETAARCVAGAFAKIALQTQGIDVKAYTSQVGGIALPGTYKDYDLNAIESNAVRCPDAATPVFGKLHAALGAAMLSINAAKGFDYGSGFAGVTQRGSKQNDLFVADGEGHVHTLTNNSGGIQGGISNGDDIYFRVAFKPVATLLREQATIDKEGHAATVKARGRHDACVLPRAVPVVESMAAMTLLDYLLLANLYKR